MKQINQETDAQKSIEVSSVTQVRPLSRCFARNLDVSILSIPGVWIIHFCNTSRHINKIANLLISIVLTAFVILVIEPIIISRYGTTLGKWAFGIKLNKISGEKLNYKECIKRCYLVWLKGYGAGIPVVNFITILGAYEKLEKDGITTWDKECGINVEHHKIRVFPVVVLFLLNIVSYYILKTF